MSDPRPPGRGPSRPSFRASRDAHRDRLAVLSRDHRLSSPRAFSEVIRGGARAGSTTVVAHVVHPGAQGGAPVQIGFIVNKSVGNAVTRNRVRRRLRHLCLPMVSDLPARTRLVVRALPAAAGAESAQLATDLESSVRRALGKADHARRTVRS